MLKVKFDVVEETMSRFPSMNSEGKLEQTKHRLCTLLPLRYMSDIGIAIWQKMRQHKDTGGFVSSFP